MFSNPATSLRSVATSDRDNHLVPFVRAEVAHRRQQPFSSFARSLFAAARPSASIRNSKSAYLQGNFRLLVGLPRLLVNTLSDSWSMATCLRNCSFSQARFQPSLLAPAFSIFDFDKELFPSAASLATGNRPPTGSSIRESLPTWAIDNRKSKIENSNYLVTFAVWEPVSLTPVSAKIADL